MVWGSPRSERGTGSFRSFRSFTPILSAKGRFAFGLSQDYLSFAVRYAQNPLTFAYNSPPAGRERRQ
eukprot:501396-Prymnesium_polylepis.1